MGLLNRGHKQVSKDVTITRKFSIVNGCRIGKQFESQGPGRFNEVSSNRQAPKTPRTPKK